MPVVRHIPLNLELEEILRWQGLRPTAKARPPLADILPTLLKDIEENQLLEAALAYEIYPVAAIRQQIACKVLPKSAQELAVIVGTIGPRLEQEAAACFKRGEALRGTLLDGIGSAAVDRLTREACRLAAAEASSRGWRAGGYISPGEHGWPVTGQRQLCGLAAANEIGVSLTGAGMLVPRKSFCMIMGLGPRMKEASGEACARCRLGRTCPYRVPAGVSGK